jgi:hypothetical protein
VPNTSNGPGAVAKVVAILDAACRLVDEAGNQENMGELLKQLRMSEYEQECISLLHRALVCVRASR